MFKPILLAFLCGQICSALYVAKGTPCSSSCDSTEGSGTSDLVCLTDDFASTTKGQTLQSCLDCTIDSTYINSSYTDGNSDQFWTLFHMKYVQQYCLTSTTTPHIAAVNACTSACAPLTDVLQLLWVNQHPYVGQYDYCSASSSAYTNNAADCARCLQSQEESVIIGNFVDTMNQACASRPFAANGDLISPIRALFDTSLLSSTDASSTAASTSSTSASGSYSSPPATSAVGSNTPQYNGQTDSSSNNGGLSTGAAAGIGAAVAVVAIGVIARLVFIYLRRRRTTRQTAAEAPSLPAAAAEISADSEHGSRPDTKQQHFVYEKDAGVFDRQVHEASTESQSHFVELPAYQSR